MQINSHFCLNWKSVSVILAKESKSLAVNEIFQGLLEYLVLNKNFLKVECEAFMKAVDLQTISNFCISLYLMTLS